LEHKTGMAFAARQVCILQPAVDSRRVSVPGGRDHSCAAVAPRLAMTVLIFVLCAYWAQNVNNALGAHFGPGITGAAIVSGLAIVALQLFHSRPRPGGARPWAWRWTLVVQGMLVYGMFPALGWIAFSFAGFLAGSALLLVPGRRGAGRVANPRDGCPRGDREVVTTPPLRRLGSACWIWAVSAGWAGGARPGWPATPLPPPTSPDRILWINQVERWFGYLTDQKIRRGSHKSTRPKGSAIFDAVVEDDIITIIVVGDLGCGCGSCSPALNLVIAWLRHGCRVGGRGG
jgi:hypothetical protein